MLENTISVVVPVFNEENIILELYDRLKTSLSLISEEFEVLLVDDGSTDRTASTLKEINAKDSRFKYLILSRNFGHQIAVCAGLDAAKGDAVIIIDGDLQDPPELIPELYNKHLEGYNVVYAKRKKRKGESFFKKITARLFYRLLKSMTSIDIPLDVGDFRIIDRKVLETLKQMPERNKFLRGQIAWIGLNQSYVEYDRDQRTTGKTGYSLKKMLQLALNGITALSDFPLRFVTNLGLIVSAISFLIIIYALVQHFVFDMTITGWTSLIVSSMFIGGIQLISLGIIGEYISRINTDVRQRPLYVVQEESGDQEQ